MTNIASRQPKGVPIGGQFAVQAHPEAGVTLDPTPTHSELIASLQQYDTATRAQQRELQEASSQIGLDRGKVGAALAAIELKKAFPAAAVVRFGRIPFRGTGVAVDPEIFDGFGTKLYPKNAYSSILDAPKDQQRPLEKALSHLSNVHDDDLESQGIKAMRRPQGTVHELDLDNALALAAERSTLATATESGGHLDLSTLAADQSRTLGPDDHGLAGVETLAIKNLGPGHALPDRNVVSMTYTLPEAANIRELYDFDDRDRSESHWAAHRAASELLGYRQFPEEGINGLPGDSVGLDGDGILTIVQHDYFFQEDSIDPDDLRSWSDDLRQFSQPDARRRLETAITEHYNES